MFLSVLLLRCTGSKISVFRAQHNPYDQLSDIVIVHRFLAFFRAIARRKLRFVFLRIDKAKELSEPSVVEIAHGRVAVRTHPFGVLDPE
jgi:hypothetical protein